MSCHAIVHAVPHIGCAQLLAQPVGLHKVSVLSQDAVALDDWTIVDLSVCAFAWQS
jgi:hypothetical protein